MKTYTFEQTGYQGGERVTVPAHNARAAWRRLSYEFDTPVKDCKRTVKIVRLAQTWEERLNDGGKTPLAAEFIESLARTAADNERAVDDLWVMWRTYTQTCEGYDQSPTFREFCSWNKLAGAGPLA